VNPFEFALTVKLPVANEAKQGVDVVKLRVVTFRLFPPVAFIVTVKPKIVGTTVPDAVSAAVQFPLMAFGGPDPHPTGSRLIPSKISA